MQGAGWKFELQRLEDLWTAIQKFQHGYTAKELQ